MPLQTSGSISLSQIQTEYGGINPISISEYFNGAPSGIENSRIYKIRMRGVSGTRDQNPDIREFEFIGLGNWGTGDRRTGNYQINISTNMTTNWYPDPDPGLNAWINGSKGSGDPNSRYIEGSNIAVNSSSYIDFDFVGSATKPLVSDFTKFIIYYDRADMSIDADQGTWEICAYDENSNEISYGNITLSESNLITGSVSGLAVWQYFQNTYISDGEYTSRTTNLVTPDDLESNPTRLAQELQTSINNGYYGFSWNNPGSSHGVPNGYVQFNYVGSGYQNTITLTYNRYGSMTNYNPTKRHMFVHIANATAAGVYQTKSYATLKGADGQDVQNQTTYRLEFNLPSPTGSGGGYVTDVNYIPSYSQPYVTISLSDFYYQAPSTDPPAPVASSIPGAAGGLGNTSYEIITGLYANNTTRTEGTTSFDNRGIAGLGTSNNVSYPNLIIQAKPGDTLNLIGRIRTNGTYTEFCEFWVWYGGSWTRFAGPSASFSGDRDFSVNYTIPTGTSAGNYALAVACSYSTIESTSYRSWKSYSLHVWT